MERILSDFSATALVSDIQANWADSNTYFGRSSRAELSVSSHLTCLHTGIPDAFLNEVLRPHLLSSGRDERIDKTLAHFRQRNVRELSWWARRRGYRLSILQASRLGYPLYRRLGFQDYGKLNTYEWDDESESPAGSSMSLRIGSSRRGLRRIETRRSNLQACKGDCFAKARLAMTY